MKCMLLDGGWRGWNEAWGYICSRFLTALALRIDRLTEILCSICGFSSDEISVQLWVILCSSYTSQQRSTSNEWCTPSIPSLSGRQQPWVVVFACGYVLLLQVLKTLLHHIHCRACCKPMSTYDSLFWVGNSCMGVSIQQTAFKGLLLSLRRFRFYQAVIHVP